MAAAWAIGVGIVTRTLEERVEGQLRNAAVVLSTWGLPYTPELLRRLAALEQSDFVLLDAAGDVAVTTSPAVGDAVAASLAQLRAQQQSGATSHRLETPVRSVAIYQPLEPTPDPRYSALVAVAPLADAAAAARRAAWWLGIAMLAATALLGTVLLAIVRNITRPLGQLSALADRIASGEREQPLDVRRADEIGALAESLNTMMTHLGRYESRLASRTRMSALGEMSARLAHEIRNPLTGLKLHLQLLAERLPADESGRVQRLLTEVQRLELLVSSTLMLGGAQRLDVSRTAVGPMIAEVLDLMAPSLAHRGILAEAHCDDGLEADVDRGRLRQALLNLIVNAADAMPQGGRLLVGAERGLSSMSTTPARVSPTTCAIACSEPRRAPSRSASASA
jgi:signal transduction histidine kinase